MNENLDLTKILKGCPSGTKFYSTVYGEVTFIRMCSNSEYPIRLDAHKEEAESSTITFVTKDGRKEYSYNGECTLFPSKDQRDWSKFERFWDKPKAEKFGPNTFHPFDNVLVRDSVCYSWNAVPFSHINVKCQAVCCGVSWEQCIPYNEETKDLVNTNEDCPEYYRWWEE